MGQPESTDPRVQNHLPSGTQKAASPMAPVTARAFSLPTVMELLLGAGPGDEAGSLPSRGAAPTGDRQSQGRS